MRWVRFTADGKTAFGILEGERITEVSGDPFAGYERTARQHALAAVKLEIPFEPKTFYCVGLNYAEHVIEGARKRGVEPNLPTQPDVGYRSNNALIAHDENVVIPADATEKVHYEGELVVVIGRRAKGLTEENALSCVLGFTIGNDVSERTWQRNDRTLWRAKSTDTFKPMGPWIETDLDLDAAVTTVRVNGEAHTTFRTNAMIFGVQRFIATMTKYMTLEPGDMIWMGTDGVSPDLRHGDVVEIDITGIGTLRNRFVREGM